MSWDADIVAVVVDEVGPWAPAWDGLVDAARHPTPFASSWWIDGAPSAGRTIVLVLQGDVLVGGLALSRRRRFGIEVFELLGQGFASPDHLDLLAHPGYEAQVVDEIQRWFSRRSFLLRAEGVPEGSLLHDALGRATSIPFSTAPYLTLPSGGPPEPVSSRVRNTVRRSRKRLVREGLVHRRIDSDAEALDRALVDLRALHRLRWPDGSNFDRDFDRLSTVVRRGAAMGRAAIHEIVVADTVVAAMLVFDLPDRRCYYQSGRRMEREWRGAGSVLMAAVIGDAHAAGLAEFDFLRGREPYKLDWTDTERVLVRLFAARGVVASVARWSLIGTERCKPALRWLRARARARGSRPTS